MFLSFCIKQSGHKINKIDVLIFNALLSALCSVIYLQLYVWEHDKKGKGKLGNGMQMWTSIYMVLNYNLNGISDQENNRTCMIIEHERNCRHSMWWPGHCFYGLLVVWGIQNAAFERDLVFLCMKWGVVQKVRKKKWLIASD